MAQPLSQSAVVGSSVTLSVSAGGSPPLAYQWSFNSAVIEGATNATLVLTDVNFSAAGTYAVTVADALGSATSSNAVLAVGNAPSISVQPQRQQVAPGTKVSFTVTASGTSPLNYQWSLDGAALAHATDSILTLSDVQPTNSGAYSVAVSSPFGSVLSSSAELIVELPPLIITQPLNQAATIGTDVVFSVTAMAAPLLPVVNSGTLQLWLKADTGVVTNSAGLVSQWQDQSGNANDASQASASSEPQLIQPSVIEGAPALFFDGSQDASSGDFLVGAGNVGIPNAFTTFVVYDAYYNVPNWASVVWLIGQPSGSQSSDGFAVLNGDMDFTTWNANYPSSFAIPAETFRICTDRVDTNLSTVEMFDTTADNETNFSYAMTGQQQPAAGYYVGGLDPSLPGTGGNGRCFNGAVAELIVYGGYVSDRDRVAVTSYLAQKYFQNLARETLSYQWQFDGTNIVGATNATLHLTNLQGSEAGSYSVTVTSLAGSVTSSNAILTPLFPPLITSSPSTQSVLAGTQVTFSAAATGTAPLAYQWQFDGANISGATNTALAITNALFANAGSYSFLATNPYGLATSSVAVLTVGESTIQVVGTTAGGGGTVVVSIDLTALGTETALGFSLEFDPSVLTYSAVALGGDIAGNALEVNENQAASGVIGIAVDLFSGAFSPGTNDVFDVTFQAAVVTNATTTSLMFGNQPTEELVADAQAQTLPAVFLPGVVVISPAALGGDVSPRPNGNETVNIADWVQEARFVAGLDAVSNGSEFQRADCAPRATQGDGQITVADWVQVGRYVVGLDLPTAAGGPTNPIPGIAYPIHPVKTDFTSISLVPLTQASLSNSIAVQLVGHGTESALGFSVAFDPALVRFAKASLGSGAAGAALVQNTNLANSGTVGFLVGWIPPATFAAGAQQVVQLQFTSVAYSNNAALTFGNTPIAQGLADAKANILSANFQNTTLAVGGSTWPTLGILQAGNNVVLSWPSAATGFALQAASAPGGNWTNVLATPATIGSRLVVTSSIGTNSQFFRLHY